jgi:hypothetical protein
MLKRRETVRGWTESSKLGKVRTGSGAAELISMGGVVVSRRSGSRQDRPDRVKLLVDRIRNNKWLTPLILAGIVIVAVGSLTDALDKIERFSSALYQRPKPPPIPRPAMSLIPLDTAANGIPLHTAKSVWGIESPSGPDGNAIQLRLARLRYDNLGLPVLSFVFRNFSEKAVLLTGVHIDVAFTKGIGGGGPNPIIITRALEPVATWNLSISTVLVAGHYEQGSWSMDMQIPAPILIARADAGNVEIRLFDTYNTHLIYPRAPGLTLRFSFKTDGIPPLVFAPPFSFKDNLDERAMLSAGGCRPVVLPQSGFAEVEPAPAECQ